jgi:hypothetical protein
MQRISLNRGLFPIVSSPIVFSYSVLAVLTSMLMLNGYGNKGSFTVSC